MKSFTGLKSHFMAPWLQDFSEHETSFCENTKVISCALSRNFVILKDIVRVKRYNFLGYRHHFLGLKYIISWV